MHVQAYVHAHAHILVHARTKYQLSQTCHIAIYDTSMVFLWAVDAILMDPECSSSVPFKAFLGVHGHPAEEVILNRCCTQAQTNSDS